MDRLRNLIIYGGTFDPVHNGHINIALQVQKKFNFNQFIFVPCKSPSLKQQPIATPAQRVEMLSIALRPYSPSFSIDLTEINRDGPSYMADTLKHFRDQSGPNYSITLLLGVDAFSQLPKWHHWEEILSLSNLCVVQRPHLTTSILSKKLIQLLKTQETKNSEAILRSNNGLIYLYDAGDYDISSTAVRQQLKQGQSISSIPQEVMRFIQENKIYCEI